MYERLRSGVQVAAPILAGFALATVAVLVTTDSKNRPPGTAFAVVGLFLAACFMLVTTQMVAFFRPDAAVDDWSVPRVVGGFYVAGMLAVTLALVALLWPPDNFHSLLHLSQVAAADVVGVVAIAGSLLLLYVPTGITLAFVLAAALNKSRRI